MDEKGLVVEEYRGAFLLNENVEEEPSSTAPSSSPRDDRGGFSSDVLEGGKGTPPSSPPAMVVEPVLEARRPVFRGLKRKRGVCANAKADANACPSAGSSPLGDITNTATKRARPMKKKPRLMQMQIDLGGDIRTACGTCGMEYIPSNAQDAALHKEFHAVNTRGVDVSRAFLKRHAPRIAWDSSKDGVKPVGGVEGFVMVVDRRSSTAEKNKAKRVLGVVNTELSAAEIEDQRLWSQVALSNAGNTAEDSTAGTVLGGPERKNSRGDRFKIYLFVSGEKCVGLCLTERISIAYKVMQNKEVANDRADLEASKSSSISISREAEPAILGISRIWTSVSHRRKGIAAALLDAVRGNFIYGMEVSKDMVAFSQPTESGGLLAKDWFGGAKTWHVYVET